MSEIKLLPCPFCGGEAMHWGGAGQHCIRCKSCFNTNEKLVSGTLYDAFETAEEAAKDWNTRKPMERIVERLEEKRKDICGTYNHETPVLERPSCKVAFNNGICEAIAVVKEEGGIE